MGEIVIILVLALILLGPDKLPEAAKQLGKGLRDFRRATDDLRSQFETDLYAQDHKAPRPALVEPPAAGAAGEPRADAPPSAPGDRAAPPATADNVPGLEAALVEGAEPGPSPGPASKIA